MQRDPRAQAALEAQLIGYYPRLGDDSAALWCAELLSRTSLAVAGRAVAQCAREVRWDDLDLAVLLEHLRRAQRETSSGHRLPAHASETAEQRDSAARANAARARAIVEQLAARMGLP